MKKIDLNNRVTIKNVSLFKVCTPPTSSYKEGILLSNGQTATVSVSDIIDISYRDRNISGTDGSGYLSNIEILDDETKEYLGYISKRTNKEGKTYYTKQICATVKYFIEMVEHDSKDTFERFVMKIKNTNNFGYFNMLRVAASEATLTADRRRFLKENGFTIF